MIPDRIASRIADDDQAGSTSNFSRRKLLLAGAAAGLGLPFGNRTGEAAGTDGLEPERLVDFRTLVNEETTMNYFPGFSAELIETSGTTIHVLRKGSGRPLLLLHGYPETHLTWHKVAPQLAEQFSVIVPDLRGYGDSGRPPDGQRHENYSFRAMAQDQVDVMRHYGHERFLVVAHDRGARATHRLCLDHPESVEKAVVMDIAPTLTMYEGTNQEFATKYMLWFFAIQPFPFPEHMIGLDPEFYLRQIFGGLNRTPGAIAPEQMNEYFRSFSDPAVIHTTCENFRAAADIDLEMDKSDEAAGKKDQMSTPCPVGRKGNGRRPVGLARDLARECVAPVTGRALDCGHFLQEESPDDLLAELRQFLFF